MSHVTLENSRGVISKQEVKFSTRERILRGKKISAREQLLSIGGKFTSKGAYFQQGGGAHSQQGDEISARGEISQQRGSILSKKGGNTPLPPTPRYFSYHAAGI